jgi:hypothetical protein
MAMSDKAFDRDVCIRSVTHTRILYYQGLMKKTGKTMNELLSAYGPPLLAQADLKFIVDTICKYDILNCCMSRKEMIGIVQGMTGKKFKVCENNYDCLIRIKRLPEMTKGGCVITAHIITSKRTEATAHQQLRWHNLIDSVWDDLRSLNKASSGCAIFYSEDFDMLHLYFN